MATLYKLKVLIRSLLAVALAVAATSTATLTWPSEAQARVGGGRSIGRSPSSSYRRQGSFSTPSPAPRGDYRAPGSTGAANPYQSGATIPQSAAGGGGFMRNMAGGLAGGFLGSMLFNSIGGRGMGGGYGYGAGGGYGGGYGGSGGGVGLLDFLLLAGVAYLGFRWWRSRQTSAATSAYQDNIVNFRMPQDDSRTLSAVSAPTIDAEEATDLFFRIQGAWTRRDLSSVLPLLGSEIAETLNKDLEALKAAHRINRLENISVRHVDVGPAAFEGGEALVTVRFTANLLDYTVDEASGQVVEGSDREPVKFAEDWTFGQAAAGRPWKLVGIEQLS